MPKFDFFTRLGLFAYQSFFDDEFCAKLRTEVRSATETPATLLGNEGKSVLDERIRKTQCHQVSEEAIASVKSKLLALKPQLEDHFDVRLKDCEEPQFLKYNSGDFYRPHLDDNQSDIGAQYMKDRKVSAVIFLNSEVDKYREECYTGGALTFYGLVDNPRWQNYGFHLNGESGLLIAFRSNILHQVEPAIEGERYTIVTWFF